MNEYLTDSPDWPVAHHDFCNWRYTPVDVVPPLRRLWSADLGSSGGGETTGADGRIAKVSVAGVLRMLDLDGKCVWKVNTARKRAGMRPMQSPSFVGDRLLVPRKAMLQCFRVADGELLWEIDDTRGRGTNVPKGCKDCDFLNGVLSVRDGRITTASEFCILRTIDLETGEVLRVTETAPPWVVGAGPWALFRKVITRQPDRAVIGAVDMRTGHLTGEIDRNLRYASRFCWCRGKVFYPGGYDLAALSVETGKPDWLCPYESIACNGGLAIDGTHAFALRADGIICCRVDTGEVVWRSQPEPGQEYHGLNGAGTEITASPSYLYTVGRVSHKLKVFDKHTGRLAWAGDGSGFEVAPFGLSFVGGRIFTSGDNVLHCFAGSRP